MESEPADGHLRPLFGEGWSEEADYEGWRESNPYFALLDRDERTPELLQRLRQRASDEEDEEWAATATFFIKSLTEIPGKWESMKDERTQDRKERLEILAEKVGALARELADDMDVAPVTILDGDVLVDSYARTADLKTLAEEGVDITPLFLARVPGEHPTRHHVTIRNGPFTGEYAVPTLAEYLTGLAECLRYGDWPNAFDEATRKYVPTKKRAETALRTFVALHVFDVLDGWVNPMIEYEDGTTKKSPGRAPNTETAIATNIMLGLHGADELTPNHVTELRTKNRRRYWVD
ncbi:MAG: hypothetical protein OEY97_04435 [Nitrospirota bacterium]|nr:hypothetical protein [Nitrospirota bacterium]